MSRAFVPSINNQGWTPRSIPGLLAEYRFNEGGGSSILDYSGNGNNATLQSGGVLGPYGLTGSASGGCVNTAIPISTVRTIILHISPDGSAAGALASSQTAGANNLQFSMTSQPVAGQTAWRCATDTSIVSNSGAELCSASWPFTIATSRNNAGLYRLSMNGVDAGYYDANNAATSFAGTGNLRLFGDSSAAAFPGLCAFALVFSTELDATQIQQVDAYIRRRVAGRSIPDTGPVTRTAPLLIISGNSLTNNEVLASIVMKGSTEIVRSATPGASPSEISAKIVQAVIPLKRPLSTTIVGLWPTPNALDVSTVLTAATTSGQLLRANGFKVYLKGPLSHGNGWDAIKPGVESAYLDGTTGWVAFADSYLSFSSATGIYADNSWVGAPNTYYLDSVHINQTAYDTYIYTQERDVAAAFLPPVSDFTSSATSVASGVSVTFTNTSVGTISTYAWNFGDGNTSTSASPSHSWASNGTYSVSCTVTGPLGSNTKTVSIEVSLASTIAALNPYSWITASPLYCTKAGGGTPTNGDLLSGFTDRSGNSRAPSQSTSANQPTLQTVSSKYVIRFDKTRGDFVQWASNAFASFTGGAEIFVVERVIDGGSVQGHWAFGTGAEDYYGFGGSIYDGFASTARKGPITPGVSLTSLNCYSVRSAPSDWQAYMNGTSISSTGTNSVGWTTNCRFGITAVGTTGGRELCELIILPPLSSGDRAIVMTYIRATWGTP